MKKIVIFWLLLLIWILWITLFKSTDSVSSDDTEEVEFETQTANIKKLPTTNKKKNDCSNVKCDSWFACEQGECKELWLFVCSPNGWVLECGYEGCFKKWDITIFDEWESVCYTEKPKDKACNATWCAAWLVKCNNRCVQEGTCEVDEWDSVIDTFEECTSEPATCIPVDTCGDGVQNVWEDCDWGNLCSNTCECPAWLISCNGWCEEAWYCVSDQCGNNVVNAWEACDGWTLCTDICQCPVWLIWCEGGCAEPGYCGVETNEECSEPTQAWDWEDWICLCWVPELFCQDWTSCASDNDCDAYCNSGQSSCLQPWEFFPSTCDGENCFYEESCAWMCN